MATPETHAPGLPAVRSIPWLDSECVTPAASGDAVASQRRHGRDDSSLTPYYEDSAVTIYHGDCREILPSLPRGLIVSDPPYNVGYHYAGYKDNLGTEEYQRLLLDACPLPCVIIHYVEDLCAISWTMEKLPEKVVAWVYPSNTARQWRGIGWWGCKPDFTKDSQPYRNPSDKRIRERIERGEQARLYDWWEIDQVKNVGDEKTGHPCQIPEDVMRRILKITDAPLVIDPFMGSGTTLRAAKDLGLHAIGIEMDERYCEIAAKRMSQEVLNFAPSEPHAADLGGVRSGASRNTTAQESNGRGEPPLAARKDTE